MKVAFVVQRCGVEVVGGAESLCLQVAQHMSKYWQVEILTTCALDYTTWANHFPSGIGKIGDVAVRRFPVEKERDRQLFDQLSAQLAAPNGTTTLDEQEKWMRAQGPDAPSLVKFIDESSSSYAAFVFFGYLYAATYFGLPKVADKAWLAPLGHDEWTIHLNLWNTFFALPAGFIFQTREEKYFLEQRFPELPLNGPVIGTGVDAPAHSRPEDFRAKYNLQQPFLLYVGRVDAAKGCDCLFTYYQQARSEGRIDYQLVVIGPEIMPVPFHNDIVYLGVVSIQEKWDAMAAADWLVAPSPHESLSLSLLEGWAVGLPAVVSAASEVLVGHCRESNGGLWYESYTEWCAIFAVTEGTTRQQLGKQGQQYVRERYTWNAVEAAYCKVGQAFSGAA
ncbi:MAG: glycosyltransferase family 4 protein [Verrucomicrobiota bacterium]|nr:glycosyltransferase family 4 protein [Verrucomicrobiota bacterium]